MTAVPRKTTRVLRIDASARLAGSTSRSLAKTFVEALQGTCDIDVVERDLAHLTAIDAQWIAANLTPADERSLDQQAALALSDQLIAELQACDLLLLATPIYNFSVPAPLKAWIDLVCRARLTFRYGPRGPEGLLHGKRAVVVIASGGTEVGGPIDFASNYIRHILGFIGISDVTLVAADRLFAANSDSLDRARTELRSLAMRLPHEAAVVDAPVPSV